MGPLVSRRVLSLGASLGASLGPSLVFAVAVAATGCVVYEEPGRPITIEVSPLPTLGSAVSKEAGATSLRIHFAHIALEECNPLQSETGAAATLGLSRAHGDTVAGGTTQSPPLVFDIVAPTVRTFAVIEVPTRPLCAIEILLAPMGADASGPSAVLAGAGGDIRTTAAFSARVDVEDDPDLAYNAAAARVTLSWDAAKLGGLLPDEAHPDAPMALAAAVREALSVDFNPH